ncbi:MAG TPA: hypothetical protein DCO83_04190 [Mucilaginibacter sp.]|nr:hypothetical protein [Mucilaginibacter sp.]
MEVVKGFIVFIRADEHNIRSNDSRTKAFCSSGFYSEVFDRLELRWRNHVVIPPSKHRSLREYKFLHNEIPTQDILYIPIERIYNLAALVCSNNQGHDNSKLQFKRLLRNDYTFNVTDFCEIRKPSSEDSLDYVEFPDKEDFKQEGVLEIPLTASSEYLIDYIDSESVYINNGVFYIKPQPHSRYTKSEYSKSIDKDIWYLFIDVETTGLLNDDYFQTSRPARAVQIAWVAYDRNGKYLFERNYLIDVRSIEIPLKAIKIHHITSALASQFGTDLKKVLLELDVHLSFAEYIVGHNIDFDIEILKWEMDNALLPENYLKHPKPICTMKSTSGLFQNPEYGDDNYLSLEALYKALFGTEFFGVHNALCDAKATAECFWELKEHWVNI